VNLVLQAANHQVLLQALHQNHQVPQAAQVQDLLQVVQIVHQAGVVLGGT